MAIDKAVIKRLAVQVSCPGYDDDLERFARAIEQAVIAELLAGVEVPEAPKGWALVPIEPTDEMIRAGYEAENNDGKTYLRPAWRYMLSAAPAIPERNSKAESVAKLTINIEDSLRMSAAFELTSGGYALPIGEYSLYTADQLRTAIARAKLQQREADAAVCRRLFNRAATADECADAIREGGE